MRSGAWVVAVNFRKTTNVIVVPCKCSHSSSDHSANTGMLSEIPMLFHHLAKKHDLY